MKFAADISQYVTIGDLFVVIVCASFIFYLRQREQRDMGMKLLQEAVNELRDMNREHDQRLRTTEDCVTRLTAIQERQEIEIQGIKSRHSRIDEGRAVERRSLERQ